MIRKFVSNVSFLVLLNVLIKPVWLLGIDRSVQVIVGNEVYGTYFAVFNLSMLLYMIIDFGITNYNNRTIAQNTTLLSEYFPTIIALKSFLAIIYFVITFSAAILLGYSDQMIVYLLLLIINQILSSFILYFRSNFSALLLFRLDSVFSILDKALAILFCSFMFLNDQVSMLNFLYAMTASYGLTFVIACIYTSRYVSLTVKLSIANMRALILKAWPYALLGVLMSIYYRIDGVMIERLLPNTGKIEAGIYAQSYRILDALNMIGVLFASLLMPIFSKMLVEKRSTQSLVSLAGNLLFMISVGLVSISVLYQQEIINLLYKSDSHYASHLFGILLISFIPVSSVYVFGTLLTANGDIKRLNQIAVLGMVLNIVLNGILIRKHQAVGAAFATVISQVIIAFLHIIIVLWKFKFEVKTTMLLKLFGFILTTYTGVYYVKSILDPIYYALVFLIMNTAFFIIVLKIIDVRKLSYLLEREKD